MDRAHKCRWVVYGLSCFSFYLGKSHEGKGKSKKAAVLMTAAVRIFKFSGLSGEPVCGI